MSFLGLSWALCLALLIGGAKALALPAVERTFKGTSKEVQVQLARKDILDQASQKVSQEVIREIVGAAKYKKNRSLIQSQIIKNSARYIPSVKSGELKAVPSSSDDKASTYEMSVTLKINMDELQSMLLEQGLFYTSDTAPIVVPMVRFMDQVHNSVTGWWFEDADANKGYLGRVEKEFELATKEAFWKKGFFVLQPARQKLAHQIPDSLKEIVFDRSKWISQINQWNGQVLLEGEVDISENQDVSGAFRIAVKLAALQMSNDRVIAEVVRTAVTEKGNFENQVDKKMKELIRVSTQDLSQQVLDAWKRGTLGSSVYRLVLSGHLPLKVQKRFKENLKNRIRDIKTIRERSITQNEIVYEFDSSQTPEDLVSKLGKFELSPYILVLQSATKEEMKLLVKKE